LVPDAAVAAEPYPNLVKLLVDPRAAASFSKTADMTTYSVRVFVL
jgi:hypothetical protein